MTMKILSLSLMINVELSSYESDDSMPTSPVNDRYKTGSSSSFGSDNECSYGFLVVVAVLRCDQGDYDLWSMRMEQYLTHTDYALWEVIMNGDAPAEIASVSGGAKAVIPPKSTAEDSKEE
nr:hypothetical protein [Tanacetum cinerariifolium]